MAVDLLAQTANALANPVLYVWYSFVLAQFRVIASIACNSVWLCDRLLVPVGL